MNNEGLRGGVIYHDYQFDDSRMAISLARTASELGTTILNYAEVKQLIKENELISRVEVVDRESNKKFTVKAKVVINATELQ